MHSQIKSTYIIHKNPQRGTKSSKNTDYTRFEIWAPFIVKKPCIFYAFRWWMILRCLWSIFGDVRILSCQPRHSNGQFRVISGLSSNETWLEPIVRIKEHLYVRHIIQKCPLFSSQPKIKLISDVFEYFSIIFDIFPLRIQGW